MFTYLIQPRDAQNTSLLLAFAVIDDTITGYFMWQNSPENLQHFNYCLFQNDKVIKYIKRTDPEHPRVHSNTSEYNFEHFHAQHSKKIDVDMLRHFLRSLRSCEEFQNFEKGQTFFTSHVEKDILKRYKKYEGRVNSQIGYVASNHPYYQKLVRETGRFPSISEHALCLKQEGNVTGCTPDNSFSPKHLLPKPEILLKDGNTSMPYVITAAIGLFGMFAAGACLKRYLKPRSEQDAVIQEVPEIKATPR